MQSHKIKKGVCSQQVAIEAAAITEYGGRGMAAEESCMEQKQWLPARGARSKRRARPLTQRMVHVCTHAQPQLHGSQHRLTIPSAG